MTEIFNRLVQENISPNAYYVLHSLHEKVKPHNFVSASLECTRLKNDGWLNENLELTHKSLIFIQELNGFFKKTNKKTSKALMGEDFADKIAEYINIFPNKKLSSGRYARTNPKNLESAFKWFFDNYGYSWDIILQATEKYIKDYEIRNYEYMRTSQYFIRKQAIDKSFESELANYCELLKSNPDIDQVYFKDDVV
jgi:hypothetical protein